mgnify:CR=1 FL=1
MNHYDDDSLTAYLLEMIEDVGKGNQIEYHLKTCEICQKKLQDIKSDIDMIGGFELKPVKDHYPLPSKQVAKKSNWFRLAAVMIMGITIGGYFIITESFAPIPVVPMRMASTQSPDSVHIPQVSVRDNL